MDTPETPLTPQQIHLWFAFVADAHGKPELASRHEALLTDEERQQRSRFMFEKDQRRHVLTRALVRSVLSRYAPVDAQDWRFEPNTHGRPAIVNSAPAAKRLSFNLSHTDELVVLAVSSGREIGVDVESTERHAPLPVADRFFSAHESAALRALPADVQPWRFWELWTLKESYIKARGMGLSIPLNRFSFTLPLGGAQVALSFEDGFDDTAERWAFWQLKAESFLVSICAEALADQATQVVCRRVTPLESEAAFDPVLVRHSGIVP